MASHDPDSFAVSALPMTIAEAVLPCLNGLKICSSSSILNRNQWAENRLAEFKLWIDGAGALAGQKSNLDARLEFEPETRAFMVQQLVLLNMFVQACLGIVTTTENGSSTKSQSNSVHSTENVIDTATQDVDMLLDQLARYTVAIRKAGSSSRIRKADRTFDESMYKGFADYLVLLFFIRPYDLDCIRDTFRDTGAAKIGIDKPELDTIQRRLIRANLKRRHRFFYAQNHARKLTARLPTRKGDSLQDHESEQHDQPGPFEHDPIPPTVTAETRVLTPSAKMQMNQVKGKALTDTTASVIDSPLKELPKNLAPSQQARTEISTTATKITYPRPPENAAKSRSFVCPCCCQPLPSLIAASDSRWKRHMAEDICPYTCVLIECKQPDTMYTSKEGWLKHIKDNHRNVKLWTCVLCDTSENYLDPKYLREHLSQQHVDDIDDFEDFIDICEYGTNLDIASCPLCLWAEAGICVFEPSDLLDHIAEHLHAFALYSLPWTTVEAAPNPATIQHSEDLVAQWYIRLQLAEESHDFPDDIIGFETFSDDGSTEIPVPLPDTIGENHVKFDLPHHISGIIDAMYWKRGQPVPYKPESVGPDQDHFQTAGYFNEDAATSSAASTPTHRLDPEDLVVPDREYDGLVLCMIADENSTHSIYSYDSLDQIAGVKMHGEVGHTSLLDSEATLLKLQSDLSNWHRDHGIPGTKHIANRNFRRLMIVVFENTLSPSVYGIDWTSESHASHRLAAQIVSTIQNVDLLFLAGKSHGSDIVRQLREVKQNIQHSQHHSEHASDLEAPIIQVIGFSTDTPSPQQKSIGSLFVQQLFEFTQLAEEEDISSFTIDGICKRMFQNSHVKMHQFVLDQSADRSFVSNIDIAIRMRLKPPLSVQMQEDRSVSNTSMSSATVSGADQEYLWLTFLKVSVESLDLSERDNLPPRLHLFASLPGKGPVGTEFRGSIDTGLTTRAPLLREEIAIELGWKPDLTAKEQVDKHSRTSVEDDALLLFDGTKLQKLGQIDLDVSFLEEDGGNPFLKKKITWHIVSDDCLNDDCLLDWALFVRFPRLQDHYYDRTRNISGLLRRRSRVGKADVHPL